MSTRFRNAAAAASSQVITGRITDLHDDAMASLRHIAN